MKILHPAVESFESSEPALKPTLKDNAKIKKQPNYTKNLFHLKQFLRSKEWQSNPAEK